MGRICGIGRNDHPDKPGFCRLKVNPDPVSGGRVKFIHRGGNDFASLRQLNGRQLPNFHWNDWPGGRERLTLQDSDRVLPGEGVAPLKEVSALLDEIGFAGTYSLEIFNKPFCENHDTPELLKLAYDAMKKNI